jgi:hypothetical protein
MAKTNHLKRIRLTVFLAGIGVVLYMYHSQGTPSYATSNGVVAMRTGAPSELTCAQCHAGEPNTGPGQFLIEAPEIYVPGQRYEITVRHITSDLSRKRWGFQLTALNADRKRAGMYFSDDNLIRVHGGIVDFGPEEIDRLYAEHNSMSTFPGQMGGASWTFTWGSPGRKVGPVTFYAGGLQADNDGTVQGDQTYTTNITVQPTPDVLPPKILRAGVFRKELVVTGENFDLDAELFLNGKKQKKVSVRDAPTEMVLRAKKSGKKIAPGETVTLQIKNPDGTMSEEFPFKRPEQ